MSERRAMTFCEMFITFGKNAAKEYMVTIPNYIFLESTHCKKKSAITYLIIIIRAKEELKMHFSRLTGLACPQTKINNIYIFEFSAKNIF